MKGINYLINDVGERTAVVIDLKTYGTELEDFLDGLEAQARKDESKEDFDTVVNRLLSEKGCHA
ncbi:hypothetical protein CLV58_114101 [Spirosoma oryzae]|uniref:Uncharacterized protein n=1 Tax=Spirosoma oryzae TaxID=1469603 RepID=A0A2T0SQ36_9BACT|nr:hypothetical protein [Spirosoma oryzae]PRY35516.1 hypothetical protein CLV58_114101 [Spirosoma oryzae]